MDERVLAKVHDVVLPAIERAGPVEAWMAAIGSTFLRSHGRIISSEYSSRQPSAQRRRRSQRPNRTDRALP